MTSPLDSYSSEMLPFGARAVVGKLPVASIVMLVVVYTLFVAVMIYTAA
jgi:hypothetical protein